MTLKLPGRLSNASLVTMGTLVTGVHYRVQPYKGLQLDPSEKRKEQKAARGAVYI